VSDQVLYRRRPALWPIWAWLAATGVGVAVLAATGDSDSAWGVGMASGVVGLAGLVPLVLSRRRYSAVTVTARELRVGRKTFAVRELDRELLERQLHEAVPWNAGKIAGGAWGHTLGERYLQIRVEGRARLLSVPARDPRELSRALLDALDAAEEPAPAR
jgi:hypothetical protein